MATAPCVISGKPLALMRRIPLSLEKWRSLPIIRVFRTAWFIPSRRWRHSRSPFAYSVPLPAPLRLNRPRDSSMIFRRGCKGSCRQGRSSAAPRPKRRSMPARPATSRSFWTTRGWVRRKSYWHLMLSCLPGSKVFLPSHALLPRPMGSIYLRCSQGSSMVHCPRCQIRMFGRRLIPSSSEMVAPSG